ncbi:hypothetical protein L2E82_44062 [Cichorium intybus]|uniref:Uncharacterized protein n=1 Tax=Cichorium intybus TaxID=13427 RepID=A0ACB8ZPV8_CICIN|nr:hypothetical protein L2E82_44062 [Cichorium intybus]
MRSCRKPHNFYRLILSDDVNKISIRIPNKFTREHRKNILSSNVLIIVSDDKVWSLGLMISGDGKLWLQQGWPEFAEHYRLKSGHLLLFNHQGKSVFHVRIFDQSSCEINYPPPEKSPMSENDIDRPLTEDDQRMAMAETENCLINPFSFEIQFSSFLIIIFFRFVNTVLASEKGNELDEQRSRKRALEAAKSFKSDNPFYSVTIKASYFNWVYAPVPFMRRYLLNDDDKCVDCVLQVSDGEILGPVTCRDHNTYGKLCGDNWRKFCDQNNLSVGDVCVFELINEMKKVLKVAIFRAR